MSQVTQRLIISIAWALVDRHGIAAAGVAEARMKQRRRLGDTEGEEIWRRVRQAIDEMQAVEP